MPERIQRRRTKGWRMPENTVYVGKPTKWGNPFGLVHWPGLAPDERVSKYRKWLTMWKLSTADNLAELRGKNLACWCPLTDKNGTRVLCHADVLLELANA